MQVPPEAAVLPGLPRKPAASHQSATPRAAAPPPEATEIPTTCTPARADHNRRPMPPRPRAGWAIVSPEFAAPRQVDMPIDISKETPFPLTQAPKAQPFKHAGREGGPVSIQKVWRLATKGLRGVKLETILIGGTRCTTLDAIERFIMATQDGTPAPAAARTPTQRAKSHAKAMQRLEQVGI